MGAAYAGAAATTAFAVSTLPALAAPIATISLPAPGGPYAIGVRDALLTDPHRSEPDAPTPGARRQVTVRVWYPTEAHGLPTAPMISPQAAAVVSEMLQGEASALAGLSSAVTHGQRNAPLSTRSKRFPVVLFSHGFSSFLGQNTSLMEELASYGFVAISLSHPYSSGVVEFPDGSLVRKIRNYPSPDPKLYVSLHQKARNAPTLQERVSASQELRTQDMIQKPLEVWIEDTGFLVTTLSNPSLPDGLSFLDRRLDLSRLAVTGMSLGGAAAGQFCFQDARCKVGVNIDGGQITALEGRKMPKPFLMLYAEGETFGARAINDMFYDDFADPEHTNVERIVVEGAAHGDMTDITLTSDLPAVRKARGLGVGPGPQVVQDVDTIVTRFLRWRLLGVSPPGGDLLAGLKGVHRQDLVAALKSGPPENHR